MNSPAQLRAGARRRVIPRVYDFKELSPAELTPQQRSFLDPFDDKLARMSYFPVCTYRVTNLFGGNLVRRYINAAENASCSVLVVEVKVKVGKIESAKQASHMDFTTRFADGRRLTTRNMKTKSLADRLPDRLVQECPLVDDPVELKRRHDARAAELGTPVAPETNTARFFADHQQEHERFMEYQVARGLYMRDPSGGYRSADKAHWRGIRNHLNPFAHRFSPAQFGLAALLAVGIPVASYFTAAPALSARAASFGIAPVLAWDTVLGAAYLLAGATVGLVLQRSVFLWTFLLTYLGVHAITGWWTSPVPFSACAALAAFYVARAAKRRKLMLLPEVEAKHRAAGL